MVYVHVVISASHVNCEVYKKLYHILQHILVQADVAHCQCVYVQLDRDAEQPHYSRLTSQSSISSRLSVSVEHVMKVMEYHPKYLQCFQRAHYYLMHDDGSLPFDYRHYIAIMVSRPPVICLLFVSKQNCALNNLIRKLCGSHSLWSLRYITTR